MKEYVINPTKSQMLYSRHKRDIKIKECYNNVFRLATEYWSKFSAGEWKVAYGYMTLFENVLCRHCFIIDENGEVLDPTLFTRGFTDIHQRYFVMKLYDDINEYLQDIESAKMLPALHEPLRHCDKRAWKWAMANNYILTG